MSIIYLEGFDLYNAQADLSARGYVLNSSPSTFTTGRFGGVALRMTNSNSNALLKNLASAIDSLSMGFAFRIDALSSMGTGNAILHLRNSATVVGQIGVTSNGKIQYGRTDLGGNKVCESAADVIRTGAWHYVEFELVRATGTGGSINIYVDGALVANLASTNTGASSIDNFGYRADFGNRDYDDAYMTNTSTKLGERRVETLRPTSDGTVQFTPNSGANNFSRVGNTVTDGDTSYVSSATVGHTDLLNAADLSSTPSAISAVQTHMISRKDDSATRQVRFKMKNGSTTTNGTTRTLTSSYTSEVDIYETNPDTAAAFTAANVNAMQLGYEVVT